MDAPFSVDDVFGYKDKIVEGRKTDNFIVIGIKDKLVLCVPESYYENWFSGKGECIETVIRRLPVSKFKEWYPNFLFNISCKYKETAIP